MVDNDMTNGKDSGGSLTTNRRTMLKGTGAAIVGASGLAAATGSTAAYGHEIETIEVDDGGWFSGWSADGSLPVEDELLIFIHGWFGDSTVSSQADDVLSSVQSGGYDPDATVAIEWPASTINFFGAEGDTEDVGEVTAGLIEDFYDAGGGNVRLVGHSLGGRCVLWAATELSSGYEIETVAPLGAAADGSELCSGPWETAPDNACEIRNYHSGNDSTVGGAYGGWGDTALGNEGADCDPDGYTDVDMTDSVSSHMGFLGDSAVGSDLADAINSGSCSDDGGDDDDGDDDSGWGWF